MQIIEIDTCSEENTHDRVTWEFMVYIKKVLDVSFKLRPGERAF